MKSNLLQFVLFTINITIYTNSNAQNFEWAFGIGDTSWDHGYSVATDVAGNVIVGGTYNGTVDFDPGPGIDTMDSWSNEGFVAKYDAQGNFIWARKNFEWWWDNVYCVKTDSAGNVYSAGNIGMGKSFIEKRDSNGFPVWYYELFFNNPSGNYIYNNCLSIAIDDSGNVYGTGYFTRNTTFSTAPLVQLTTPLYIYNTYIVKLNAYGNLVWVKQFEDTLGMESNWGRSIAVDKLGNIYATGTFIGTVDFDPDSLSVYTVSSASIGPFDNDVFILKLNNSGNFIWAESFYNAANGDRQDLCMVLNDSADLFITGAFNGNSTDFDPGPGTYYMSSGNYASSFICRLDSAGSFKMAKKFRPTVTFNSWHSAGNSIDLDKAGNIYTSGSFSGSIDFDPDTSDYILTGYGGYISRLNQNGDFLSAVSLSNGSANGMKIINSISTKDSSNIYSTGYFNDTLDFDPSGGNYFLYPNIGSQSPPDAFIWKLSLCNSPMQYDTLVGCDSITVSGQTYFNTGTYLQTFINSAGCDSTIQWQLTINKSSDSLIIAQACDSIQYNGFTYFTSGLYQQTFSNSFGCDSTLNLQLTINKSFDSLMTIQACDSLLYNGINHTSSGIYPYIFTASNGCDSIINLDLTINQSTIINQNITACQEYFFNGAILTASGIYFDTLSTISGCDSTIILNLTINTIDTSVTQNGITLTANATGLNYLWLDCNNNFQIIPGATNQSFTPTQNGNYALLISSGNCFDTSSCYEINSVGIWESTGKYFFSVYPNPFASQILITIQNKSFKQLVFTVENVLGQVVFSHEENNLSRSHAMVFDLNYLSKGIYLLIVNIDGERMVKKIAKE